MRAGPPGGTLICHVANDGRDALKTTSHVQVGGGDVTLTAGGKGSKGLKAPVIELTGGHMTIQTGGGVVLSALGSGFDPSYCTALKADSLIVHGPPAQPEVAVDENGTFLISGGIVAMSQINSNMNELPIAASGQRSVLLKTNAAVSAGRFIHIEDASGNTVVTFKPVRNYSSLLLSSSALVAGASYKVYTPGTCTGTLKDGIYTGGTYSGGTLKTTFTSSSVAQTVTF